jgi:hypothetical protein
MCPGCGMVHLSIISMEASNEGVSNYNTTADSHTPFRVRGAGGKVSTVAGQVNTYKKTSMIDIVSAIEAKVYQKGNKFDKKIINDAAGFFFQIQFVRTLRGNPRTGTIAACFSSSCAHNNMIQKPKFIADLFDIHQNHLSEGEKIIDEMVNFGLVTSPFVRRTDTDKIKDYLNQYFDQMGLDYQVDNRNYYRFCVRIVQFTIKYHIALSSIISSKCAGVLYMLSCRYPEIDKHQITTVCKCSLSTAIRYAKEIESFITSNVIPPCDPEEVSQRVKMMELAKRRIKHIFNTNGIMIVPPKPVRHRKPRVTPAAAAAAGK